MTQLKYNIETDLLKQISAGKYREKYLVYNRKSTDEPDNQKNSITYQKAENTRFAHREALPIAAITLQGFCAAGVISERHSGFSEDTNILITDDGVVHYRIERPKFQKMLQFVSEGYFKGVICLCWDRISRNKGDDTLVRKMMRNGADFRFVYAKYDQTSSGALHMDIDGMFAEHHSRVTSEKVRIATKTARERGICTYRAPIGYLNQGKMTHKATDPVRAPIIQRMYELYASGDWTLSDLARFANSHGFVTVPMRRRRTRDEMLAEEDEAVQIEKVSRPVTENHVSRILTNPFYTGKVMTTDGSYVPSASHEAIVSDQLFDGVQTLLKQKRTSIYYERKLDLPLRGLARCFHCRRVFTPYVQKRTQYFGSRCAPGCPNKLKNFSLSYLAAKIEGLLSTLYFTEDEIDQMNARISTDIALHEVNRRKELDQLERKKRKTREDLGYICANKLALLKAGVYSPEGLQEEESKLKDELIDLQTREQRSDEAMHETMKDVAKLSELVKNVVPLYKFANLRQKDEITRCIFSELSISETTLQFKCKTGFECLENHLRAVCDPIAWLSELGDFNSSMRLAIKCTEQLTVHSGN